MPSVAGSFYPADPIELKETVIKMLIEANSDLPIPKAIIAPHAGYIYSGPIAASAYACLKKAKEKIKKVVILAPSHQVPFEGIATTDDDFFQTPLGNIPIDRVAVDKLVLSNKVKLLPGAFSLEHSLEVQLPFLQETLENFELVPLLIGQVSYQEIAKVLHEVFNGFETLIIISSDLSHYYDYKTAQRLDNTTVESIINLDPESIHFEQACGRLGIQALLVIAKEKGLKPAIIDLRNSGDTAGSKDQVVGYAAVHFYYS